MPKLNSILGEEILPLACFELADLPNHLPYPRHTQYFAWTIHLYIVCFYGDLMPYYYILIQKLQPQIGMSSGSGFLHQSRTKCSCDGPRRELPEGLRVSSHKACNRCCASGSGGIGCSYMMVQNTNPKNDGRSSD